MKTMKSYSIAVALLMTIMQAYAQQVASSDMVALINTMPQLPPSLTEAYQISYAKDATAANAKGYYTDWTKKVEVVAQQNAEISKRFYTQNPTGMAKQAQPTPSKATPQQEAAIKSATNELVQKMMTDPAFAQKFQQMSEKEQHAYMAKMLEGKGLTPVQGVANTPSTQPAGLDIPWAEICTDFIQSAQDRALFDEQNELQMRYTAWHDEVNKWAEKEINKLPLISFGEYGKDRDPEKVKAINQKARQLRKEIAAVSLKELGALLMKYRQKMAQDITAFNTELKKVQYGKTYDFGIYYSTVLQTQQYILQAIHDLTKNEISVIEACAKYEYEQRLSQ